MLMILEDESVYGVDGMSTLLRIERIDTDSGFLFIRELLLGIILVRGGRHIDEAHKAEGEADSK